MSNVDDRFGDTLMSLLLIWGGEATDNLRKDVMFLKSHTADFNLPVLG